MSRNGLMAGNEEGHNLSSFLVFSSKKKKKNG